MFGVFKRKPPAPPRRHGDSPEWWSDGDIAECINKSGWFIEGQRPDRGLKFGQRSRVIAVSVKSHPLTGQPIQWLKFPRHYGFFAAYGFRKVRPQADELVAASSNWLSLLLGKSPQLRDREDA